MIQIEMDMPKSCAVCRFNSRCDDCEHICNYCMAADFKDDDDARIGYFNDGSHEYDPEIGFTPEDRRQDWCPLKEVKHGKWIKADSQQYFRKHYPCFTCSECGYRKDSQKKWNYCPNCGARIKR